MENQADALHGCIVRLRDLNEKIIRALEMRWNCKLQLNLNNSFTTANSNSFRVPSEFYW